MWKDGEFLNLPSPKYKFEFIGDSISSGEGTFGAKLENDWCPCFLSAVNNYCYLTAKKLSAEFRIFSQSGWGIMSSWDGDRKCRILDYYDTLCGFLDKNSYSSLGTSNKYNFASWTPDVVIINLGTNDFAAICREFSLDYEKDLSFDDYRLNETINELQHTIINNLFMLRKYNPNACLVWCCGMISDKLNPIISEAVDKYVDASKDTRAYFLALPKVNEETIGSRAHPGLSNHEEAADVLGGFLTSILQAY